MLIRLSWCSALLSVLAVRPAAAQLETLSLPPLESGWSLLATQPRDGVAAITQTSQHAGGRDGKLSPQSTSQFRFAYDNAGHLRTIAETIEGYSSPRCIETFDGAGHSILRSMPGSDGRGHNGTSKTLATYDAQGLLTRYSVTGIDGKTVSAAVSNTSDATGQTRSWQGVWAQNQPVTCSAKYGFDGKLVETSVVSAKGQPMRTTITYNEQDDVDSTTFVYGPPSEKYEYVYEYDAHHNWTKQTVYRTLWKNAVANRQLWQIHSRKMVYGKPTQLAAVAATTRAATSRPAPTVALKADNPDVFVATRGDPRDPNGFWNVETIEFLDGNRFILDNTMPVIGQPGRTTNVLSMGTWQLANQALTLTIKTVNLQPAPASATEHPLVLRKSADGNTLTSPDGQAFTRKKPA